MSTDRINDKTIDIERLRNKLVSTSLMEIQRSNLPKLQRHEAIRSSRYNFNNSQYVVEDDTRLEEIESIVVNKKQISKRQKTLPDIGCLKETTEPRIYDFGNKKKSSSTIESREAVQEALNRYAKHYKPKNCSLSPEKPAENEHVEEPSHRSLLARIHQNHRKQAFPPKMKVNFESDLDLTPFQLLVKMKKQKQEMASYRVMTQISKENAKRLRKVLIQRIKMRELRREVVC